MNDSYRLPWNTLDNRFRAIQRNPLKEGHVDMFHLAKELTDPGWIEENIYEEDKMDRIVDFSTDVCARYDPRTDLTTIHVPKPSSSYRRDIDLCKGLAHFFFGLDFDPQTITDRDDIVFEWIGRSMRVTAEILRRVVGVYDVEPKIYDLASYQAFTTHPVDLDSQGSFEFARDRFQELQRTARDYDII